MRRVVWSDTARDDYFQILRFIADDNPDAAERVVQTIEKTGNALALFATGHPGRVSGTYTAEGITAIADALRVNGSLTKLSLAKNELGEEGTKAICEALEQSTTLKELDISGGWRASNIGGPAGVKHVAKMLGVNGGLTKIE